MLPSHRPCAAEPPGIPPFARAFVAIEIDEQTRAALQRILSSLARCDAHVGWVPVENIHLTLAFLGNVARFAVPDITQALDRAVSDCAPFSLTAAGLGVFGRQDAPRVVWAGICESADLLALQSSVASALRSAGTTLERRPFAPHLTLGRVRSPRGRDALLSALGSLAGAARSLGRFEVRRIAFLESIIGPTSVSHRILHDSPLGRGRSDAGA